MVCVDASLVVKLIIPEPLSQEADALWERWIEKSVERIAPSFMPVEVISALRRRGKRGELPPEFERSAVEVFTDDLLPLIELYEPSRRLLRRAWSIARELETMHAYDAIYIALAEEMGCQLWTADRKLYNAVKG